MLFLIFIFSGGCFVGLEGFIVFFLLVVRIVEGGCFEFRSFG